uniref:Uncharacterized protein n=1 Tax=Arundo donax TaxID=35708 RepID=A0A0A9B1X4_ARUDO
MLSRNQFVSLPMQQYYQIKHK